MFYEPFNSLSHLAAVPFFLLMTGYLFLKARANGHSALAVAQFGSAAVLCLGLSGIYHSIAIDSKWREFMRILDHVGVFLLIASSFAPSHFILFRGVRRWAIFLSVWFLAATAIFLKVIYFHEISEVWTSLIYLGLGWMGLATARMIYLHYGFAIVRNLLLGGLFYTLGAILDIQHIAIADGFGSHEVFHLFVIAGLYYHWLHTYQLISLPRIKVLRVARRYLLTADLSVSKGRA